jgi:circadian clock protein KaiC
MATLALEKAPTGITGLDEITNGGLPKGRPTLICGSAGCGKTLFSMEFLVRGATEFGEPGVFVAFEETAEELGQNVASLGFDLEQMIADKKLVIDHIHVEPDELEETGEYDLAGLFIRLGYAIDRIGAKRVVLDTVETLFSALPNEFILRAELRRLFRWLKDKGVTAVITAERGEGALTRQGLEEYVSDCVILLDHRVTDQVSTRRLRIVKYRGTAHGTNEYPFLIDEDGFSVLPITSVGLRHGVSKDRVPSGVPELDRMLGGAGYYRGSSVLISGTSGTGKTSLAAHFVDASCRRGERSIYFAFEESADQIVRNMASIGLDLGQWITAGLLKIVSVRPTYYGLEMHLAMVHREIVRFKPATVVVDPITSFTAIANNSDAKALFARLVDLLKTQQITSVFTSLSQQGQLEQTDIGVSSTIDTWLLLRDIELNGERNRGIYILKSRGMKHSNQIREFMLTDKGIRLIDVYLGTGGVLTGSARIAQEANERAAATQRQIESQRHRSALERKRRALEAQIAAMRAEFEAESSELDRFVAEDEDREEALSQTREDMAERRR